MAQISLKNSIRGIQFVFLVILIVAATYISLGRIVFSFSNVYRDNLVRWMEERLNMDVNIGSIEGKWSYFDPEVTFDHVVLGESLYFDHLTFRINTLKSLLNRTVVVTVLKVKSIEVHIQESQPSKWNTVGFPESLASFDLDLGLEFLNHLITAKVEEIDINLTGTRADYVIAISNLVLESLGSDERRISVPLKILGKDSKSYGSINLLGEYRGNLKDSDFKGDFYADIVGIDLEHLIDLTYLSYQVSDISIDNEVWVSIDSEQKSILSNTNFNAMLLRNVKEKIALGGELSLGIKASEHEFRITGQKLSIQLDNDEMDLSGIYGSLSRQLNQVAFIMPEIKLQKLSSFLLNFDPQITSKQLHSAIEEISPSGLLRETFLYLDLDSWVRNYQLVSVLDGVNLSAYLGFPEIRNLSGVLSLSPERGHLDIDSKNIELYFKSRFSDIWPFDSIRGRILYYNDEDIFRVSSRLFQFNYNDLSAVGKIKMNFPRGENLNWELLVGLNESLLLRESYRYLPDTLPSRLLDWLESSVISGKAEDSGLLFHGAFANSSPRITRTFESYLRISNTNLKYHPEWPTLSDLNALFYINDKGLTSRNGNCKIFSIDLTNINTAIRNPYEGQPKNINILADIKGGVLDGFRVLNETPVKDKIMNIARHWSGTGSLKGNVEFEIPFSRGGDEQFYTDISVLLSNNDLKFSDQNLDLKSVNGNFRYETHSGFTASQFAGELFGEKVFGSIATDVGDHSGEVVIDIMGEVEASKVYAWSGQAILSRFLGKSPYRASLHIPFGLDSKTSYFEVQSNLVGTELNFPSPLGKKKEEHRSVYYRQEFSESGSKINFRLGQLIAHLSTHNRLVTGGRVHFGSSQPSEVSYESLLVTGALEHANYEDWYNFFLDIRNNLSQPFGPIIGKDGELFSIDIGNLNFYSLPLSGVSAEVKRLPEGWQAFISNENITGEFIIPDKEGSPLVVNLSHLRFPKTDEINDYTTALFPDKLIDTNFTIDELFFGDEGYGRWSFELRPSANGVSLINLEGRARGISLLKGSKFEWTYEGKHVSSFEGNIDIEDLAVAQEKWGYASSIEGSNFNLSASFFWEGRPTAMETDILEGHIKLLNGEGRFVQADPGAALKLLGIFDFEQLGRRLSFDFSDVVQKGWSFNKVTGSTSLNKGKISILEPIVIEGSSSNFKIAGTADLNTRELDNDMIVTLRVSRNLPWYAAYSAIATGPLAGLGVLLAQRVLKSQINQVSSAKYTVSGTIESPKIELHSLFNDSIETSTDSAQ